VVLDTEMDFFVLRSIPFCRKCAFTITAFVGLFFCMSPALVLLEKASSGKGPAASFEVAFERLFAGMRPHVTIKTSLQRKFRQAKFTLVGFLFQVDKAFMISKVSLRFELFAAILMLAFVIFFSSVDQNVTLQL